MSKQWALKKLIGRTIDVYSSLSKRGQNVYYTEFLKALMATGKLSTSNASYEQIYRFFRILLDASGIISATEGDFDSFSIGSTKHVGKKKDIEGKLANEESFRDWMCSNLFQGWVKYQKPDFHISKDLRYILPNNEKTCDFKVTGDDIPPTLVECKRIHPEGKGLSSDVSEKIFSRLLKAKDQLVNTEKYFNEGDFYKLVILDVSSYGDNIVSEQGIMKTVGFQENTNITPIIHNLKHKQVSEISEIDAVIICWSNLYYFQGYPRAFAYYTRQIPLSRKPTSNVIYEGWTIEFYPAGKDTHEYLELFISSIARPSSRIKAFWYNSTDNLVTYSFEN